MPPTTFRCRAYALRSLDPLLGLLFHALPAVGSQPHLMLIAGSPRGPLTAIVDSASKPSSS